MKLFEYQAKEVFSKYDIVTPKGILARTPEEVLQAAQELGGSVVVKSQLLRGGRGKLGLVKRAGSAEEACEIAKELFASKYNVRTLLIEACVDFESEMYVSISMDAKSARAMIMACASGGVEIEELAKTAPEKIIREYVDLNRGLQNFQLSNLTYALGIPATHTKQLSQILRKLYACFRKYDAELVEINPLFITKDGFVAGDGKLIIDDNSVSRHPEFPRTREYFETDMEFLSAEEGIPYIQFDGDISLMCAGAGLTTTVYDLINYAGGSVANYLEFGGPNYMKAHKAMEICLKNKSKVILIVTFGTIARADVIANGVVESCNSLKLDRPLVACVRGTNEEEAVKTLQSAGIVCFSDTEEAVQYAVDLCRGM